MEPSPGPPMDFASAALDDPTALWDWGDLLDFTVDDQLPIPFETSQPPPPPEDPPDRVRKRDPRLTCSNFLAGRIPCACPELDELLKEEEEEEPAKKRSRAARAAGGKARCQVPGCEADISELKGYHRRHRVCLRCANAAVVVIDGDSKRYCQQCGKFHVLSDFDEGKRSCRRKLERHNNRRRRKSADSKGAVESVPTEVVVCDDDDDDDEEAVKGSLGLIGQVPVNEALVESESGQISTSSAPDSKNIQSDSVASFGPSGDSQIDGQKDDFKNSLSATNWDNKSAYSSACPTGRISFKLYDWNPAEFPRRLRQQIFQWLGSMPVELEGYIRPGCIILTVFVAMPKLMWSKLSEDPISYLHDFVVAPGSLLTGKGNILVYLNNMTFQVTKNGTSMMTVKVEVPRLHYVHPTCFEAGKPMEFFACGSNLLQPKLRFLISFAGKYLEYDYCVASPCDEIEGNPTCSSGHQLYKINISHTEPNICGPAFIEVENESGLSNFIPVLIADKETCSEIQTLQQRLNGSVGSLSSSCEVSTLRQAMLSEFVLDLAWLLKQPALEKFHRIITSSQIQRFSCLLHFLIQNKLIAILEKIILHLKKLMDNMELNSSVSGSSNADMRLLLIYIDFARDILQQKVKESSGLLLQPGSTKPERNFGFQSIPQDDLLSSAPVFNQVARDILQQKVKESSRLLLQPGSTTLERNFGFQSIPQDDLLSSAPVFNQDMNMQQNEKLEPMVGSAFSDRSEAVPLLNREVVMNMNHIKEWPRKSCGRLISRSVSSSRPTFFVIATVAVCIGICAVVLHPNKVSEFAVSIRRCLFDKH